MASYSPDQIDAEVHICDECNKQFPRKCDLNKHAKLHTRPFKCSESTCKYHDLGWPTAKELDRHVNDKHSESPRTFPCKFRGCLYESKRESNCKQHMEKTHHWTYVKSKANGRRLSSRDVQPKPEPVDSAPLNAISPFPFSGSGPSSKGDGSADMRELDYVLFPPESDVDEVDEQHQSADQHGYLPWNSPMTRLRKMESFLEQFGESFNPARSNSSLDDLIDPRLADADVAGDLHQQMISSMPSVPKASRVKRPEPSRVHRRAQSDAMKPLVIQSVPPLSQPKQESVAHITQVPAHHMPATSAGHRRTASGPSPHSKRTIRSRSRRPVKQQEDSDDEEEEDDGDRRAKKRRTAPENAFKDTEMPDIFHFAHPTIYHRDVKEKFSPCHTDHKDISTLVRHLSRPAHRLRVTDRVVSSFEIGPEEEYRHPRVGICRRCWVVFADQDELEVHIAEDCEKVSKGKREKWQILHDALTPIVDNAANDRMEVAERRPAAQLTFAPAQVPSTGAFHLGLPPIDDSREFVPMAEHLHMRTTLTQLLIQSVAGTPVPQGRAEDHLATLVAAGRMRPLPNRPVHETQGVEQEMSMVRHQEMSPDKASLVGHMDSHRTDVDPLGLMEDVKSLSRTSSGMVEGMPHPKAYVPTEDVGSVQDGVGAVLHHLMSPTNTDSAYGTGSKRPSYTQEEIMNQLKGMGGSGQNMATEPPSSMPALGVIPQSHPFQNHVALTFTQPQQPMNSLPPDPAVMGRLWQYNANPFAGAGSDHLSSSFLDMAQMPTFDGAPGPEEYDMSRYIDLDQ